MAQTKQPYYESSKANITYQENYNLLIGENFDLKIYCWMVLKCLSVISLGNLLDCLVNLAINLETIGLGIPCHYT
jgi:hypothetical protein